MAIKIHNFEDFISMRKAGALAAKVLDYITDYVKAGVTTDELNRLCHEMIINNGAIPAPLNYNGFPKSICTSINHEVCHGVPGPRELKEGDIVNIDVTVIVDGWHGDTSRMYYVGEVGIKANRLCKVTYDAMMLGIEKIKPGVTLGDMGHVIQSYAERHGYSVVRDYVGHGIGKVFHAEPHIFHHGKPGQGVVFQEGMFFTVEPILNAGRFETKIAKDGQTITSKDRSLSAQFEHSVGVTNTGAEIFTTSPKNFHFPPYY